MKLTTKIKILTIYGVFMILAYILGISNSNNYDYVIELDELHGIIINNDTIPLDHLEEYIYVDNI